jgi:hypothetical protein
MAATVPRPDWQYYIGEVTREKLETLWDDDCLLWMK